LTLQAVAEAASRQPAAASHLPRHASFQPPPLLHTHTPPFFSFLHLTAGFQLSRQPESFSLFLRHYSFLFCSFRTPLDAAYFAISRASATADAANIDT